MNTQKTSTEGTIPSQPINNTTNSGTPIVAASPAVNTPVGIAKPTVTFTPTLTPNGDNYDLNLQVAIDGSEDMSDYTFLYKVNEQVMEHGSTLKDIHTVGYTKALLGPDNKHALLNYSYTNMLKGTVLLFEVNGVTNIFTI